MMRRRDYAGPDDLVAMQLAVQRAWTPESRWHVGDLAWGRHAVPDREPDWRTALWEGGQGFVVAWGWMELPGHLELHVDPTHPEVAGDVLAWFDEVATGADRSVSVMEADAELAGVLRHEGYLPRRHAPFFQHCLVDLDESLGPPLLPEGYRVRAVREDEAEARAAAHRAAWRPGRIGEMLVPPVDLGDAEPRVTTQSYREVMAAWPYRHDLDQVVETSDGTLVASALGWLDEINRVGELEPVGTDPRHERKGLGSAVTWPACTRCGALAPRGPWFTRAGTALIRLPGASTSVWVSVRSHGPSPTVAEPHRP